MRIAIVAGEASGDLLAAHLIRALRARLPQARFVGIGGPRMEAEGFESWWPAETLAVMGVVDVLASLPELLRVRRGLLARLKAEPPDVFIGVDAPDFNLSVERRLRRRGVRTIHYVSPSIWAWRGHRVHKIGRAASRILCLFPFEPELYTRHGYQASFVGHPLADVFPLEPSREAARELLQIEPDACVVAMLPGSRAGEVGHLAACYVATMQQMLAKRPALQFLVPLITRQTREQFEMALFQAGAQDLPVRLLFGHAHEALTAADVALVASGTATLETALLKRPMVITYKLGKWTFRIARWLNYLPWAGLPNILAREFIVPELLQDQATPQALSSALLQWLDDADARRAVLARFEQIHLSLRQNNAERAADAVLAELKQA
ncbi:MAG: lipid-A-disaccharide synthase [Candidatus Dactylopiibacterium carminicum]|uniref:Lipid-A-disaccharide synthase n=1 Tax=Candidatus Dactylopiibacterium carminicum TaxID=857335 RepID=A0A272EQI2_9RHOO|nr:lipid-A-disaccharide synthase [Candidatus Dactylopiibacterium carminicum]KAF7598553.1 lipid-A-disaccharide synthase [Candidatus Dactylopiibacterium carminicum]PAS92316.1 MAG: lipid-A-disaccharide synthase [Candidatus Dactylopiibacterium carminicum]PAS95901.1 MAG: lipid-A-disaccharide synthase [Candidatus Dactylopiibacterium carminicum]PAS98113.1 MAG: lipid-A-disaccharide synthase [Candidatus Dactylopiibacterium carminicum]